MREESLGVVSMENDRMTIHPEVAAALPAPRSWYGLPLLAAEKQSGSLPASATPLRGVTARIAGPGKSATDARHRTIIAAQGRCVTRRDVCLMCAPSSSLCSRTSTCNRFSMKQ